MNGAARSEAMYCCMRVTPQCPAKEIELSRGAKFDRAHTFISLRSPQIRNIRQQLPYADGHKGCMHDYYCEWYLASVNPRVPLEI